MIVEKHKFIFEDHNLINFPPFTKTKILGFMPPKATRKKQEATSTPLKALKQSKRLQGLPPSPASHASPTDTEANTSFYFDATDTNLLSLAQEELSSAKTDLVESDLKVTQLQARTEELEETVEHLEEDLNTVISDLNIAVVEKNEARSEVDKLNTQLSDLKSKTKSYTDSFKKDLEEQAKQYIKENTASAKEETEELKKKLKVLEADLDTAQEEAAVAKDLAAALEDQLEDAHVALATTVTDATTLEKTTATATETTNMSGINGFMTALSFNPKLETKWNGENSFAALAFIYNFEILLTTAVDNKTVASMDDALKAAWVSAENQFGPRGYRWAKLHFSKGWDEFKKHFLATFGFMDTKDTAIMKKLVALQTESTSQPAMFATELHEAYESYANGVDFTFVKNILREKYFDRKPSMFGKEVLKVDGKLWNHADVSITDLGDYMNTVLTNFGSASGSSSLDVGVLNNFTNKLATKFDELSNKLTDGLSEGERKNSVKLENFEKNITKNIATKVQQEIDTVFNSQRGNPTSSRRRNHLLTILEHLENTGTVPEGIDDGDILQLFNSEWTPGYPGGRGSNNFQRFNNSPRSLICWNCGGNHSFHNCNDKWDRSKITQNATANSGRSFGSGYAPHRSQGINFAPGPSPPRAPGAGFAPQDQQFYNDTQKPLVAGPSSSTPSEPKEVLNAEVSMKFSAEQAASVKDYCTSQGWVGNKQYF